MEIPTMTLYIDTLPVHLTPFVGRQVDLERLLALLHNPSVRLVTILGTGGIGKTRLALELAHILQEQFQHGTVFIPLAHLSRVDELPLALAGALGVQLPPGGDCLDLQRVDPIYHLVFEDSSQLALTSDMRSMQVQFRNEDVEFAHFMDVL